MSSPSPELERAYRATAYRVEGPDGRFSIHIGQTCPELDALLTLTHTTTWAYITACNPRSVPTADAQNQARQRELEERVRARFRFYRGEGVGDDGKWPPEPSLLVLGIDGDTAARLGREFGQHAVVVGTLGGAAELLWLSP
jgi:hypothetical protein